MAGLPHHQEEGAPHDVLAAEEFPLGAADPVLHHRGPVPLPPDPTGIDEPHDVLAAEEFAMPAPSARHPSLRRRPLPAPVRALPAAGAAALLWAWRWWRGRRARARA
jgi:hypothetical protein